ncbi:aminoglycoside phosphotransferase/kinase family protein [Streptomyces odonnellii]|uniref:phosphotransferase n=1 Tax=Streptomyces odonnellii TaxID=1417980 RepID=UPI000625DA6E|nr:phosphotransferase [Streptomyces odonnellii]
MKEDGAVLSQAITAWCGRELGAVPVERLFASAQTSEVAAVRLDDGRRVVIKARPDEAGRARSCVEVQRALADSGFPCPRPLTAVAVVDRRAVHAEQWCPGGDMLRDDGPETAAKFAVLLATLVTLARKVRVRPPLPNPVWLRWDHEEPGLWPAYDWHDARAGLVAVPQDLEQTVVRIRARMARAASLERTVGHGDWESQNIRWRGGEAHTVHDWDSLAWLPEAAIAGAASGAFASTEHPTLAPVDSSAAFLDAYQEARGRAFTSEERQVAWAASLWPAAHNARTEVLHGKPPIALHALRNQTDERLTRADA